MAEKRRPFSEYEDAGFLAVRRLPDGRVIGVYRFMYSFGLCVDIQTHDLEKDAYAYRYCYASGKDAAMAVFVWDGVGDPPGPWIKLKGHPDRPDELGPGAKR